MARYQNTLNRIFSAGIVWDPNEPLPEELREDLFRPGGESQPILNELQFPRVNEPFCGPAKLPIQPGHQVAATWPINGTAMNLPRFTVQEQGRNVLPPLSVTVDASIVQDTARVTVTQLFWNDSGIPIKKAAFTFPLATGCTVTDFSCRIGANKIIKGAIKPKEEARDAFRDHIRRHETAAGLLEQDTPEIFTTTLGNVPQKTKVKVELTYITVLKHRFADSSNTITLTIPTSIAPRYGDAPEEYNDAATTGVPQGLSLEVEIVESEKITSIDSISHAIAVTRRRGPRTARSFADLAGEDNRSNVETASVTLESGRIFLDRDFVLDIVTTPDDNNESPQAWLEEHPTLSDHKSLMLTLPSGFLARNAPPMQQSEILFLADCSGSMKDKIKPLRSAMKFFLKGIPQGRKFNIWCFGTNYASWQPESVDYTEDTLKSALSWVKTDMRANMGGTELLPAVQALVGARKKALVTDVIVLTDGQTWRLEQTLEFIQKTRGLTEGRVRFFALGIGRAVSHALVDGIAKAGGGYAEVVQEASQGGWEDRVVSMAKAALMSAHLGPLHLEFNIQDQTGNIRSSTLADAKRSPADTSALNPFNRNRVYFHLDCIKDSESIKSVRIEVQANHNTQTLTIPVTILDKRDTTLHKLAARAMLDDLERGRSHIHLGLNRPLSGSWQEASMVRKEAEQIACKWSLVSKWTSFFLTEEPCTPSGDDALMDGVVGIDISPGDDLLQPHQAVQHIASLESASPDTLGMDDFDSVLGPRPGVILGDSAPAYPHNGAWNSPSTCEEERGVYYKRSAPAAPPPAPLSMSWGVVSRDGSVNNSTRSHARPRQGFPNGMPDHINNSAQPGAYSRVDRYYLKESTQGMLRNEDVSMAELHSDRSNKDHNLQGPDRLTAPARNETPQLPPGVILSAGSTNELVGSSTTGASRPRAWGNDKVDVLLGQQQPSHRFDSSSGSEMRRGGGSDPRSQSFGDTKVEPKLNISTPMGSSIKDQATFPSYCAKAPEMEFDLDSAPRPMMSGFYPQDSWSTSEVNIKDLSSMDFDDFGSPSDSFNSTQLLTATHGSTSEPPSPALEASENQRQPQSIPPPPVVVTRTRKLKWEYAADVPPRTTHSNPLDRDDPTPASRPAPGEQSKPSLSDRDFVISLLNFQQYDGSIDFGTWEVAEQVLGKAIAAALRPLQRTWPDDLYDRALWTATVHVLLQRHCQSCKALWELMAIKTASYCLNMDPLISAAGAEAQSGLLEVVGEKLEGLELPFRGEQHQQQQQQAQEETWAVDGVVPEVVTVEPPAQERIPGRGLEERAKRDRKKRKAEKGEQGEEGADLKANSVSISRGSGSFLGPLKSEVDDSSRRGTKSRRESSSAGGKGKSVAVSVPVPVADTDTGAEDDASWEQVEAGDPAGAVFQPQETLRF